MIKWTIHSLAWAVVGAVSFWFGGRAVKHFNPKVSKEKWA